MGTKEFKSFYKSIRIEFRYFFVGIWNTFFAYIVFFLLDNLFLRTFPEHKFLYILAMFFAYLLAIFNSYLSHKFITFRSITEGRKTFNEFLRFILANAISLCLNLILLWILVEFFYLPPKIAAIITLPMIICMNYFFLFKFTFKDKLELTTNSKMTNE